MNSNSYYQLNPLQSNNAYIFPGFGLGLVISGAIRVHDDMLLAACKLQTFLMLDGVSVQRSLDKVSSKGSLKPSDLI